MKPHALRNAPPASLPRLMITGLGGSICVIAVYKFLIKPLLDSNRRREAELCANAIFEQQMKQSTQEQVQDGSG